MCSVCNLSLSPATVSSISDQGELTHMHSAIKTLGDANWGCPFSFLTATYPAGGHCLPFPLSYHLSQLVVLAECLSLCSQPSWPVHREHTPRVSDTKPGCHTTPAPASIPSWGTVTSEGPLPHKYFLFIKAIKGKKPGWCFQTE